MGIKKDLLEYRERLKNSKFRCKYETRCYTQCYECHKDRLNRITDQGSRIGKYNKPTKIDWDAKGYELRKSDGTINKMNRKEFHKIKNMIFQNINQFEGHVLIIGENYLEIKKTNK